MQGEINSMIESFTPIINSNAHASFLSTPSNYNVSRINPDKLTFLKSNLLVSNVVSFTSSKAYQNLTSPDAYSLRNDIDVVTAKQAIQNKRLIKRVHQNAIANAESTLRAMRREKQQTKKKITEAKALKEEIQQKIKDILSGKEQKSYLGRSSNEERQIKGMRENMPSEKIVKMEATRVALKEKAKKTCRTNIKHSQTLLSPNTSLNLTSSEEGEKDQVVKPMPSIQTKEEQVLLRLFKAKSEKVFMQEQVRRAVWLGFIDNWNVVNHHQPIKKIKKKVVKHNTTQPKKEHQQSQILQFHDLESRQRVLKQYSQAFASTAASYKILPV